MQEMKVVRSGKQKFITWLPCRRGWRGRTSELDAQRRRRVVDSSARKPLRVPFKLSERPMRNPLLFPGLRYAQSLATSHEG